jgi:SAM-dependent methyltransferase
MEGYDERSYGDGFADVYDNWYADVTDVDATVTRLLPMAGPGGRVLDLGVGTGRLAVTMALAGLRVVGVDSCAAMLGRLDATSGVTAILGVMVDDLPDGPFDAALVAYNTIFNLLDATTQQRCFAEVADRLRPGGAFVVEVFVPDAERLARPRSDVSVRTLAVDHVVLSVSVDDPDNQRAEGQFVQFSEAGGVRLRPWSIRWATPAQLDEMATRAGLTLVQRFADMAGGDFDDDSAEHVSIYVKPEATDGK